MNPDDIIEIKPSLEDLKKGAHYASFTLPWTFNRMMQNENSKGQQSRALNIAKGIVGQEALIKILEENGTTQKHQIKSHRDDDLFDFKIHQDGKDIDLDVKTFHVYTDYDNPYRSEFSKDLIATNAEYSGPDWRIFFPLLVPHNQINQSKQCYCFAFATSIDIRKNPLEKRDDDCLCAFPYSSYRSFIASSKLCLLRESASKGFFIKITYDTSGTLTEEDSISLQLNFEWEGEIKNAKISLEPNLTSDEYGPFSSIDSFQLTKEDYENFFGRIFIDVSTNDFTDPVLDYRRININSPPNYRFVLGKSDFCNLILPNDYTLYYIGWISKNDFITKCKNHPAWVWPKDSVNKFNNQSWSQISDDDVARITKAGFADCIQRHPDRLNAGWMKTSGQYQGACCYVYPNVSRPSGVRESNLYVIPEDLKRMRDLGKS